MAHAKGQLVGLGQWVEDWITWAVKWRLTKVSEPEAGSSTRGHAQEQRGWFMSGGRLCGSRKFVSPPPRGCDQDWTGQGGASVEGVCLHVQGGNPCHAPARVQSFCQHLQ